MSHFYTAGQVSKFLGFFLFLLLGMYILLLSVLQLSVRELENTVILMNSARLIMVLH